MTLQKKIGIAITIFSIYTIVINIVHWQVTKPGDSLLAIIFGILSLILFGASIFHEHIVYKIVQVVLMAVASILTLTLNDQFVFAAMGMFFIFGTIATMWAYDFFEKRPIAIVCMIVLGFFIGFTVMTSSVVTAGALTFGLGITCYLVWVPLHDKIKRLVAVIKKADQLLDEAKKNG